MALREGVKMKRVIAKVLLATLAISGISAVSPANAASPKNINITYDCTKTAPVVVTANLGDTLTIIPAAGCPAMIGLWQYGTPPISVGNFFVTPQTVVLGTNLIVGRVYSGAFKVSALSSSAYYTAQTAAMASNDYTYLDSVSTAYSVLIGDPVVTAIPTWTTYFDGNGATSGTAPSPIFVAYGGNAGFNLPGNIGRSTNSTSNAVLTRTGYTFLGWNTSPTATAPMTLTNYTFTPTGDTVLYAVWKANS
jgi:uncharacterized repeat protein (TIGR02543 family)